MGWTASVSSSVLTILQVVSSFISVFPIKDCESDPSLAVFPRVRGIGYFGPRFQRVPVIAAGTVIHLKKRRKSSVRG
jgi:hypothetical protein